MRPSIDPATDFASRYNERRSLSELLHVELAEYVLLTSPEIVLLEVEPLIMLTKAFGRFED